MKIRFLCFLLTICVLLSGCKSEGQSCKLKVVSNYRGYGIDGQKLESGSFSESHTIKAGDVLYESYYGKWELKPQEEISDGVIAEIVSMNADGVTVIIHGEEKKISYETAYNVPSLYVVYDGVNFNYTITASDYVE